MRWNTEAGFTWAYDFCRDLAIEGFFRFAAMDLHPGTHPETHDVIAVRNISSGPVTVTVRWTDATVEGGGDVILPGQGTADVVLRRVHP